MMTRRLWAAFRKRMGKQVLTVPGRLQEVRRVCQFMRDGAHAAGFGEDALFQIELACDEAVTNILSLIHI